MTTQQTGEQTTAAWRNAFGAGDFAKRYDDLMVRPLFGPWAEDLCERVAIGSGERVIDVAAGTGAVAIVAARRTGRTGRVTATDLNPGMLEYGRSKPVPSLAADIEWIAAPADALGVDDAAYDIATCQQGFQFFADRAAAASELHRVLRSGGRAGVACWATIDQIPIFAALLHAGCELFGDGAKPMLSAPNGFPDPDALGSLLRDAGFDEVDVTTHRLPFVLDGVDGIGASFAASAPQMGLGELDDDGFARFTQIMKDDLADVIVGNEIRSFATANVAIARKR